MTGASQSLLTVVPSQKDLVDEYAELDRQVQSFKPKADRHEELKKLLKLAADEKAPADQVTVLEGKSWDVQASARANERSWADMFKLYRALGRQTFLEICSVAFGKAEEILGKDKVASLVTESRTGSRRLKPVLKAPVAA